MPIAIMVSKRGIQLPHLSKITAAIGLPRLCAMQRKPQFAVQSGAEGISERGWKNREDFAPAKKTRSVRIHQHLGIAPVAQHQRDVQAKQTATPSIAEQCSAPALPSVKGTVRLKKAPKWPVPGGVCDH